jgi:hypothetical protein
MNWAKRQQKVLELKCLFEFIVKKESCEKDFDIVVLHCVP